MKTLLLSAILLLSFLNTVQSQNVGIGTSLPATKLHIAGNSGTIRLEGVSSSLLGTYLVLPSSSTDVILYADMNGDFKAIPSGIAGQTLTLSAAGVPAWATGASSGWSLTGNAATNPPTNFIGTTDLKDWVVKTNNLERMRVASGGSVAINSIPSLTEMLTVTGGTVYSGINGLTTKTTSGSYGIHGNAKTKIDGYLGYVGTLNPVNNVTFQVDNPGVYGIVTTTGTNPTPGVYGVTTTGANTSAVIGSSNVWNGGHFTTSLGSAPALVGYNLANANATNTGIGVYGLTGAGAGYAVYGQNSQKNGVSIFGQNTTATSNGTGHGVYGQTAQSAAAGTYGQNLATSGTGVVGSGNAAIAVYLVNGSGGAFTGNGVGAFAIAKTAASGTGMVATGNNLAATTTLATGSGGAFGGQTTGIYAKTSPVGLAASEAIYTTENANTVRVNYWDGTTQWKIAGLGTMPASCTVKDSNGQEREMYSAESPEFLFTDYGYAQLSNGKVHVEIDPIISKNVIINADHPLRVFVQLEGNCNGVYVTNKTSSGFDVYELNYGNSNVAFQYQIICNVADQEMQGGVINHLADIRFKPALPPRDMSEQDLQIIESRSAPANAAMTLPYAPK